MHHLVARTQHRQLLFTTWDEGLLLWEVIVRVVPAIAALCVMPNHLHLLTALPCRFALGRALSGFTRGWHARHGTRGDLFGPLPSPELVSADKRARVDRYLGLNACRAGLTSDPLAWPLCSVTDALGLADRPIRPPVDDPWSHFRYLVADDRVTARDFPVANLEPPDADRLLRAVSQATRTPLRDVVGRRGRPRTLAVLAWRTLHGAGVRETSRALGISHAAVGRVPVLADPAVDRVARLAAADVPGLDDLVLRRMLARSRYAGFHPPPRPR